MTSWSSKQTHINPQTKMHSRVVSSREEETTLIFHFLSHIAKKLVEQIQLLIWRLN